MHTPDGILMYPVAHIRSDFPTKFGIPKQSGLSQALEARVVFCPEYRSADAVRGLEEFSHIWLLWQFSAAVRESETFSPTVRPPRLGGNKRVFPLAGGFSYQSGTSLARGFPFRACAFPLCPHSSDIQQYRNLNLLSIGYASRPRLRSRLPQGRSALPWKPWIFGRKDSHLTLATHSGILSS